MAQCQGYGGWYLQGPCYRQQGAPPPPPPPQPPYAPMQGIQYPGYQHQQYPPQAAHYYPPPVPNPQPVYAPPPYSPYQVQYPVPMAQQQGCYGPPAPQQMQEPSHGRWSPWWQKRSNKIDRRHDNSNQKPKKDQERQDKTGKGKPKNARKDGGKDPIAPKDAGKSGTTLSGIIRQYEALERRIKSEKEKLGEEAKPKAEKKDDDAMVGVEGAPIERVPTPDPAQWDALHPQLFHTMILAEEELAPLPVVPVVPNSRAAEDEAILKEATIKGLPVFDEEL